MVAAQGPLPPLAALLESVRGCRVCERDLPLGPRPILQVGQRARLLIVGQAPGARVHATGIPWSDPSGARLRDWMGVASEVFYDASKVAIVPIGMCYPGRGTSGDLPPRKECAPLWLDSLIARMPAIELTLLIGLHAQRYFLGAHSKDSLAGTVRAWREYSPRLFPLPHPSPRNQSWLKRNPWFERQVIPPLRRRIRALLAA